MNENADAIDVQIVGESAQSSYSYTSEAGEVVIEDLTGIQQELLAKIGGASLQANANLRMEAAKWIASIVEAGERGDLRRGKFVIPSTEVREYIEADEQLNRAATEILAKWSKPVTPNRAARRELTRQAKKRK